MTNKRICLRWGAQRRAKRNATRSLRLRIEKQVRSSTPQLPKSVAEQESGQRLGWTESTKPWVELGVAAIAALTLAVTVVPDASLRDLSVSVTAQELELESRAAQLAELAAEIERNELIARELTESLDVKREQMLQAEAILRHMNQENRALELASSQVDEQAALALTNLDRQDSLIRERTASARWAFETRRALYARRLVIHTALAMNGVYWQDDYDQLDKPIPPDLLSNILTGVFEQSNETTRLVLGKNDAQVLLAHLPAEIPRLQESTALVEQWRQQNFAPPDAISRDMLEKGVGATVLGVASNTFVMQGKLRDELVKSGVTLFQRILTTTEYQRAFGAPKPKSGG